MPTQRPTTAGRSAAGQRLTVGRLARRFGLSRSALLYYDRIGLLRPSARSSANYRLYTAADQRRLEQICRYREVGLSLEQIEQVLALRGGRTASILEQRLTGLNAEIALLRQQQRVIVRLLQGQAQAAPARTMTKKGWVAVLRAAGLSDRDMDRWHHEFERMEPESHQDLLESLGIPAPEIAAIRRRSRRPPP